MTNQGGTGHVTRVFQQADNERQYKNLRNEHQERANTAKQCIGGKIFNYLIAYQRHQGVGRPG